MRLKKFYADNMSEAMRVIKDELGPDAVILSSKQVREKRGFLGLFSKKVLEVMAGYEDVPLKKADTQTNSSPFARTLADTMPPVSAAAHKAYGGVQTPAPAEAPAPFVPLVREEEPKVEAVAEAEVEVEAETEVKEEEAVPEEKAPLEIKLDEEEHKKLIEKIVDETLAGKIQETIEGTLQEKLKETLDSAEKGNEQKMESLDAAVGELKTLIGQFEDKVEYYNNAKPEVPFEGEFLEYYNMLVEGDVKPELAHELCTNASEIANSREIEDKKEVLAQLMRDAIGKVEPIKPTRFKQKVVMLVGPTGVGKTTTLVKLASQLVVNEKLSVGIINTDVFRVAAQDQLRAYCDILNTEMLTVYKPEEIVDALLAFKSKDVVFLDTAGKVSDDESYKEEIMKFIKLGEIEDIYLTLSASTSDKVTGLILENYAFLKTHNIIVTKVDEVKTRGMILNIANEGKRPLSYVTNGQGVPDDIELIAPDEVIGSILEN